MRRPTLSCAIFALALAAASAAHALPASFSVDPVASSVQLTMSVLGSGTATPLAVTGGAAADVTLETDALFGAIASAIEPQAASLAVADLSLVPALPAGLSLTLSSSNLGASLAGPLATGFAIAPGTSVFDFGGTVLSLDTGTLSAVGTILLDPIDVQLDLAQQPIDLVLPLNSIGTVIVSDGALRWTLPLAGNARLFFGELSIDLSLSGPLVLDGARVPEPSSVVLLGSGLLAIGARLRRWLR